MSEVEKTNNNERHLTFFNIIVLVLSIYVLGALMADTFTRLPEETSRLLHYIDTVICFFFLADFFIRLYQAENKWRFMRWGWIDLLSSIPAVDFLRVGRTFHLLRMLRILRAFRSIRHIVNYVFRNRMKGTFTTVAVVAILMVIFSAIAILQVETDPDSNIKTAEDAIWWAYVTITTVGYGDRFPVTTEGRIIAAMLMTVGVGLFGTFTGFVASWFVDDKKEATEKDDLQNEK